MTGRSEEWWGRKKGDGVEVVRIHGLWVGVIIIK